MNLQEFQFASLKERIKKLEDSLFKKTSRLETTRAQQMLLLKHSGLLEHVASMGMNKNKTAEFLSLLLNRSSENIEDDLSTILSDNSPLLTKKNYQFLASTFENLKLSEKQKEVENILENLQRKG